MLAMLGVSAVGGVIDAVVNNKRQKKIEKHNKRITQVQNKLEAHAENARSKDTNISSSPISESIYNTKIRRLENEKK